jgi:hypothetical protein
VAARADVQSPGCPSLRMRCSQSRCRALADDRAALNTLAQSGPATITAARSDVAAAVAALRAAGIVPAPARPPTTPRPLLWSGARASSGAVPGGGAGSAGGHAPLPPRRTSFSLPWTPRLRAATGHASSGYMRTVSETLASMSTLAVQSTLWRQGPQPDPDRTAAAAGANSAVAPPGAESGVADDISTSSSEAD